MGACVRVSKRACLPTSECVRACSCVTASELVRLRVGGCVHMCVSVCSCVSKDIAKHHYMAVKVAINILYLINHSVATPYASD